MGVLLDGSLCPAQGLSEPASASHASGSEVRPCLLACRSGWPTCTEPPPSACAQSGHSSSPTGSWRMAVAPCCPLQQVPWACCWHHHSTGTSRLPHLRVCSQYHSKARPQVAEKACSSLQSCRPEGVAGRRGADGCNSCCAGGHQCLGAGHQACQRHQPAGELLGLTDSRSTFPSVSALRLIVIALA